MKTVSKLITRFVVFFSALAFFTACVEDDDFDTPVIPPAQELEEILSEGGTNANFISCLNEDFESYDDDVTSFDAYENVTTYDTRLWTTDSFSGNKYLKLSAYKAKGYVYSYFVIPVNFDKADEFSFKTQDRFFAKGNPLKVFIVEDYTIEDNIAKAKMTDITEQFTIANGTTGSSTKAKVSSGIYNLSEFKGNGFIAFKYEGDGASITTTIHLDDIKITDKDDSNCTNGGGNPVDGCGGNAAEAKGCLTEDFERYDDKATSFDSFFNASQKGAEKAWQVRTFGGNKYIQMSAFKSGEEDDWFIVPVDFDKADEFSFETKAGFDNGTVLKVYTSTEHDGSCTVTENQWKDITSNFDVSTGPSTGYATDYTPSKSYSLSSLTGKGYIAFRYEGNGNGGKTTTMQIENITITDKEDSNCSGTTNPTDPTQIHKGGLDSAASSCLLEDFETDMEDKTTFSKYETISISNDEDETFWIQKEFGGNKHIEHSAFKKGKQDDWFLVEVDFDKADQMSFETKDGFDKGNVLTVLYSTTHQKGNDVNSSDWVDITSEFTISSGSKEYGKVFVKSGEYSFPANVSGNGYIAFRYQGDSNTGLTTTMQIDNINLVDVDDKACYGEKEECSTEEFNSFNKNDTTLTGYQIINTKGTRKWTINEIDGNKLIEETAFNNGAISSWFILGVDFDQAGSFQFDSKDGSNNGQVLTVHYSTDYDENGDPTKATWTNITSKFKIANDAPNDSFASEFTASGTYNFQNLSGKGYIAFKYDGEEDKGATTTMQIDNIRFGKKDENSTSCTFNLKELTTTNPATQIHKGGEDAQPLGCYNLDFKDVAKNTDSFKAFEIVSTKGDNKLWKSNTYNNNSFLEISGYQAGEQDDWVLINVDFNQADTFSFKSQDGYNNGQPLTVWYSTSHAKGDDITENDWTEITSNFDIANSAPSNGYSDSFTDSKEFSLSGISGNGFIAFRFVGGDNKVTTTMRIDDIKITDKEDSTCNSTTPPPTSTQIHKGGRTAEPKGCYNEDFSDMEKDNDVFDEFETVSVLGDDAFWKVGRYTQENNFFAQFSAYQKEKQDDWFLMYVDFDKADTFEFKTKDGFNNGLVLTVYYSTTHRKGADIQENQWTNITSEFDIAKDAPGNTYADAFTNSKQYSLANISGQGFIAFRYEGGGDSNITTLMQIDDIKIIDNDDSSCGTTPPTTGGNGTDKLFFSEYAEGAGNDKYIEIYNPTNDEIDLTRYELRLSGNNDSDWTPTRKYTFAEGKTLAGKTVYSIANPQANDDIKAKATDVKGGITFFNGDDALGLFFDADGDGTFETLLDIIGVKTNDPGKGWDAAGISEATFDHTLVRKASIEKGNSDWSSSAGTTTEDSEWIVKDKGDFNSLGIR